MRRKLYELPLWGLEALMHRLAKPDILLKLENWPADAKIVAAHVDPAMQRILLSVDSETFPEVPIGALLYVESPTFSYRTLPRWGA